MTLTLAIVNPKGGSGKTTTAAFVAHSLHEQGHRVLAVDADPQGSLFAWHQRAGWPLPAVALPSAKLHRELSGITGDLYTAIVIDTPGTEHGRSIALSAIRAASHMLVPIAPTPVEAARLAAVREMIEDATDLRPDEAPPVLGVLLVRALMAAASTRDYREAMADDGWPVLRPVVARLERFAQAFGLPIERASSTGYGDAVDELLRIGAGVPA